MLLILLTILNMDYAKFDIIQPYYSLWTLIISKNILYINQKVQYRQIADKIE